MKIALCYYSSTGNTELACRYIAHSIPHAQWDLIDTIKNEAVDLSSSDAVGFATATFYRRLPDCFSDFVAQLPQQNGKPAFVLNTYGAMSGRTLKLLDQMVTAKGFHVIAGHSLLTPENLPPFIVKGWGNATAPDEKEMAAFNQFIVRLAEQIDRLKTSQTVERAKIKIGWFDNLIGVGTLAQARKEIGTLSIDKNLCAGCATCSQVCPHDAIHFDSKPIFDSAKCHGCWRCFNHCPQQAIFTPKIKGKGHYPQPIESYAAKLSGGIAVQNEK